MTATGQRLAAAAAPVRVPRAGRLRRLASGQAGPGPALALAAVALLSALIAVAGPRELTAARNLALHQQLATLGSLDTGIAVTGQWSSYRSRPGSEMPPGQVAAVSRSLGRGMRPPVDSPAGLRWAAITMPELSITDPPPGTILDLPPVADVTYLAGLARNTRLVSGSLPGAGPAIPPGRHRPDLTLAAAVTAAAAARFHLRPGSELVAGPFQAGDPGVILRITGVVTPVSPAVAIWQSDPVLAAPQIVGRKPHPQYWAAGFFIGPGELTATQTAYSGATIAGTWFYPLDLTGLTAAGLPALLAGINAQTTSSVAARVQAAAGPVQMSSVGTAANLGNALAGFSAQEQTVAAIDSLLIAGLVVAGLFLLLVCARLAADTHESELALLRARGASSRQLGARMAVRTGCLTAPALAAGVVLSVLLVPDGGTADSWLFGGIVVAVALLAPAVIAAWRHRRARPTDGQARDRELAATRQAGDRVREVSTTGGRLAGSPRLRRLRRAVGELTVVAAAAAALVLLRQRGTATGADPFLSAAPVLVAAAAGLLVARAYPALVRGLLAPASRSRGLVGFLGVATAARSRLGALLPALALVLTLTLAAFGALITGSVTAGQRNASWQQVGADVLIQAPGGATIPAAGQRAVAAVAGIHRTAAVYTAQSGSPFAATLSWPRAGGAASSGRPAGPSSVGLVVTDPARYAALAAATPWPAFPAALLARPRVTGGIRAVPVLAADGTAVGHNPGVLELDGIRVPVVVVGRIGATPAMPAGGSFVVLPGWAAARFPSIHGPGTLLATGTPASLPALRAAVTRTMPGSQLTVRRQVLAGLAGSPALQASTRLAVLAYGAAAALSVVALLFGFAVSAQGRELLITRLSALGITDRQARALAVADTVPLLAVAIAGMLVAVAVLTLAAGPVLDLAVFTNSAVAVPVRPGVAALAVPVAAAVAVMLLLVAAERALSGRPGLGATLRELEVR